METSRETKADWTRKKTVLQTTGKPPYCPNMPTPIYHFINHNLPDSSTVAYSTITPYFSRILRKNIENRGKPRKDRKWIRGRLRNRTRKKSKNRLKEKRKICQRDENWNKFIYPTILSSIFTCLSSKTRRNYRKIIYGVCNRA